MLHAAYSFQGIATTAITCGEVKDTRRKLIPAVHILWMSIVLLYLFGALAINLTCPSDDDGLSNSYGIMRSPFVVAMHRAGVPGGASTIVFGNDRQVSLVVLAS